MPTILQSAWVDNLHWIGASNASTVPHAEEMVMSDGEGQFTNDIMQVLSLTDQPAYEYIMKWWGPMDKWNICPTIDGKPSMKADTCPLPRPLGFSISIWLLPQCYLRSGLRVSCSNMSYCCDCPPVICYSLLLKMTQSK